MKVRPRTYPSGRIKWVVDATLGQKRRQQLAFDTKGQAEAKLQELEAERAAVGRVGESLTHGERVEFAMLRDRLRDQGATMTEAVQYFLRHRTAIKERISLRELVRRCRAEKTRTGRTKGYVRAMASALSGLLDAVGDAPAYDLTRDHVREWLASLEDLHARTRNNYLRDLRAVLAWGRAHQYLATDPTEGITAEKFHSEEIDWYRPRECRVLLQACPLELRAFLALALFAGIRPHEVMRMRPDDVQVGECLAIVRSKAAKIRQRRVVHLEPAAVAWLEVADLSCIWKDTLRGPLTSLRGALGRPWVHDGLRHTFATCHYAQYRDAPRLQAEMGHRSGDMLHRHYRGLATPKQAAEFWALTPAAVLSSGTVPAGCNVLRT